MSVCQKNLIAESLFPYVGRPDVSACVRATPYYEKEETPKSWFVYVVMEGDGIRIHPRSKRVRRTGRPYVRINAGEFGDRMEGIRHARQEIKKAEGWLQASREDKA